jgi:hypothetical protein
VDVGICYGVQVQVQVQCKYWLLWPPMAIVVGCRSPVPGAGTVARASRPKQIKVVLVAAQARRGGEAGAAALGGAGYVRARAGLGHLPRQGALA